MLSTLSRLNRQGVLGNNKRLREYILPLNKRRYYPLVDSKHLTTKVLQDNNIPHPETLGLVQSVSQFKKLHPLLKEATSFVVKPSRGAMGNGIMIVEGIQWDEKRDDTILRTTRKDEISFQEFTYYLSLILSGVFSLDGTTDTVMFQQKINPHPALQNICHRGIADIRIILFHGFPVMSMMRLPSKESGGRGNLHQGAVGCGLRLKDGKITFVTQHNRRIFNHPDFPDVDLKDREVPYWESIINIAAQCGEVFPLAYLGVDIVVDPVLGPLVLEVNARPGLSIQIANQKGLVGPLKTVAGLDREGMSLAEKINFSRNNF